MAVTLEQCWHRVPGGTARAALDTVTAVAERGDVDQIGVSARHRAAPDQSWQPSIAVRALPLPRVALYDSWQRLRRPRVERATGPVDLVHATGHVASASRAPWVATVHDLHFVHEPAHFTARGASVANRFLALVRDEAALVLCPSEATRTDCAAAGIDADRLRVIPWGTSQRAVPPSEAARVRATYALERPFVLFAGTVEPRKNLPRLLEAFARLEGIDAELVLVGPEGWADLPESSARRLGFVPRADLDALYAAATVVCYPSLREGFGLPVLEAMAQGAAVVTSAGTSTAEVAGDAALLVDPLDVDAIAEALRITLSDPDRRHALRSSALARAATFTWSRTAELTVQAYRDAVASVC
ncbi:MAG: glycosyltransferase family 1 protein [Acidimicrobiales bacterium]|nr:glycosyltransferase family 1 protein [Acidimicrobiales bacterium]